MIWSYFIIFAVVSVVLWAIGAWAAWRNRRILAFWRNRSWTCNLLFLHSHYVDNIGTSTTSNDGRNAFMV